MLVTVSKLERKLKDAERARERWTFANPTPKRVLCRTVPFIGRQRGDGGWVVVLYAVNCGMRVNAFLARSVPC